MNSYFKKISFLVIGLLVLSVFVFDTSKFVDMPLSPVFLFKDSTTLNKFFDFSKSNDVKEKKKQFFNVDIPLIPVTLLKTNTTLNKLPDFSTITDVKQKKKQFFNTLYPIVKEENIHVLKLREVIGLLKQLPAENLANKQKIWINAVATHYKVTSEYGEENFFADLLARVDVIPPSLALAQAAIESGWGTSRFATIGNNLFGQWCFSKGCGMVPLSRSSGKAHEVAKFTTVNHAVRAYLQNLNTNAAYQELRKTRIKLRTNQQEVTGLLLAKTLNKYSEEGDHYVDKVSKLIKQNKLQNYTVND